MMWRIINIVYGAWVGLTERNRSEDEKIVFNANLLAWKLAYRDGIYAKLGTRWDRAHYPQMAEKWRRACQIYQAKYGIDAQAALERHEREIRRNSAVLHVDRR